MFKINKKQKRGFTLIELLVVVAIIGILSSVVLASLNSARGKARDAQRISNFEQIRNALNLYASDNGGSYPWAGNGANFTSWSGCGSGNNDWQVLATMLHPYISSLALDPFGHIAGCPSSDAYWEMYAINFDSSSIYGSSGHAGSCFGHTILFLNSTEGNSIKKQDCQFDSTLQAVYPNAIIMVIN